MWLSSRDTVKPGLALESGSRELPHLLRTESPAAAREAGAGFPDSSLKTSLETKFHSPVCSLSTSLSLCLAIAARAWCQVAQKFTGGIGNKLCGECLARWGEGRARSGARAGWEMSPSLQPASTESSAADGRDAGAKLSPADQAPRSVSLSSSALWRL